MSKKISGKKTSHKNSIFKRAFFFKKVNKALFFSLIGFISLYFIVGSVLNPRFFLADAREKAGIVKGVATVSVRVIDVPEKPVVTATARCSGISPYVHLNWAETLDTNTYDISRDGLPLISGITAHAYRDTTVSTETSYSYIVTAQGPRGTTPSDPATATTGDCVIPITPSLTVVSIGGIDVTGGGTPRLSNRSPNVSGTTNLPNALMQIEITNSIPVVGTSTANNNGYWSWNPPINLEEGTHTITVTATDPVIPSLTITIQKTFTIVSESEEKEEKKNKAPTPFYQPLAPIEPEIPPEHEPEKPSFLLTAEVLNPGKVVYAGKELLTSADIVLENIDKLDNLKLKYRVYDSMHYSLLEEEKIVDINGKITVPRSILIPKLVKPGRFTLHIEALANGVLLTADVPFEIREAPLFSIGKTEITWSWIMSNLSWMILWLLLILLIFIILFAIEHHRSTRALFHITEEMLARRGQIPRRKGVAR